MKRISEQHRFLQLCGGIWCAMLVGVLYAFAILSHEMKSQFGITQRQVDTITTIGMVLDFFSFPAGIAFDKFGPRFVNVAATITMATGVAMNGLIFCGAISGNIKTFGVAAALTFWPAGWFDVGTLMTNLYNFPNNRGDVIVLQKTFMGLGSSILAVCYSAFFREYFCGYSFFVMCVVLVFGFFGAFMVTLPLHCQRSTVEDGNNVEDEEEHHAATAADLGSPTKNALPQGTSMRTNGSNRSIFMAKSKSTSSITAPEQTSLVGTHDLLAQKSRTYIADRRRLRIGFVLLAITIVFLTTVSLVNAFVDVSNGTRRAFGIVCAILVLSFPLMAFWPFKEQQPQHNDDLLFNSGSEGGVGGSHGLRLGVNLGEEQDHQQRDNSQRVVDALAEMSQNEFTFKENLVRPDLWLLWLCCFGVWGANATIIMNLSQIYRADNNGVYKVSTDSMLVALSGIGSALGRVVVGLMDRHMTTRRLSPTLLLPVPSFGTIAAIGLFLVVPAAGVVVPFFMSAFAFGFSWAVVVLVARMMFKHDVGKHYDFMYTGGTVALIAFNWGLFGHLYDEHATTDPMSTSTPSPVDGIDGSTTPAPSAVAASTCDGRHCFQTTFIVLAAVNLVCVAASILLHKRWVRTYFYSKLSTSPQRAYYSS